jgi:hypothetical protein
MSWRSDNEFKYDSKEALSPGVDAATVVKNTYDNSKE